MWVPGSGAGTQLDAPKFDGRFHYRQVIEKLNYLENGCREDTSFVTHQCARFCEDPREPHVTTVEHLVCYLVGTKGMGIAVNHNRKESFSVYIDADFSGNWVKKTAMHDDITAKSRTGYIITYAGCPILWASKLQSLVTLSTTEAEYVALSRAAREAIVLMNFLQEIQDKGIAKTNYTPDIYCKMCEDNSGALELVRVPTMRPRTKHINAVYHHFRSYMFKKEV
eukprot:12340815-Ditylum_brightwellii.AAC.1